MVLEFNPGGLRAVADAGQGVMAGGREGLWGNTGM